MKLDKRVAQTSTGAEKGYFKCCEKSLYLCISEFAHFLILLLAVFDCFGQCKTMI